MARKQNKGEFMRKKTSMGESLSGAGGCPMGAAYRSGLGRVGRWGRGLLTSPGPPLPGLSLRAGKGLIRLRGLVREEHSVGVPGPPVE